MINVNCTNLKENIKGMDRLIDDYTLVQLNLFLHLKNSCMSWQDGNSIAFNDEILEEKKESEMLLELFKNRKEVFDEIYYQYINIGEKIRCNPDNFSKTARIIEDCKGETSSIISSLNGIDYDVSGARDKLVNVSNLLENVSIAVNKHYNKVIEIERDIDGVVKNLDELAVREFVFNFAFRQHNTANTVDMISLQKDIDFVKYYSSEEKKTADSLFVKMLESLENYDSPNNTNNIIVAINETHDMTSGLLNKRELYSDTLTQTLTNYSTANTEAIQAVGKGV